MSVRRLLTSSPLVYRVARRGAIVGRWALRRLHEPDLEGFRHFDPGTGSFLDVGANSGQSALSYRLFDKRTPILSIEPQPEREADLRVVGRLISGFRYEICALGECGGTARLKVPYYRGVALSGEASIGSEAASTWAGMHGVDPSEISIRTIEVEVRRLDEMGVTPAFVKLDVEEHELEVLRGAEQTLEAHRPILMVERSGSEPAVRSHLEKRDYRPLAYLSEQGGFAPIDTRPTLNAFYVPAERSFPPAA